MSRRTFSRAALARLPRALGIDRDVAARALVLALSAWVAFAIAATLHVQNAYWAAMPTWVVAQASRGLLLERAFFRVVGTLLGAGAGFALLHLPLAPVLLLALLGLWMALNAGLTHLLRGAHGYGPLLAGITAAIVVIPAILAPDASLGLALARVECTLIGVVVVTVITGLLTPASPRRALYQRACQLAGDAVAHAAALVRGGRTGGAAEERRILGALSELEAGAALTLAGSVEGYRRRHDVEALIVGVLEVMSAAQVWRPHQGEGEGEGAALAGELDRVAAHLRAEDGRRPVVGLGLTLGAGRERLADAAARILDASDALRGAGGPARRPRGGAAPRLAPPREWPLAVAAGLVAGGATFAAATTGYLSGSTSVLLGAMGVATFSMILGSLPLPQTIAPKLAAGVAIGVVAATVFRLFLLPAVASTFGLVLAIAPFLLLGGFMRASPRTAIAGVDANMCFLLASQAGAGVAVAATTGAILADGAALVAAACVVAGGFLLLPRRPERQAVDAARYIRRDLLRMLARGARPAAGGAYWQARSGRQILRLALHLQRANTLAERWPGGVLAVLNLGHAIVALQRLAGEPGLAVDERVTAALAALPGLAHDPAATARTLRGLAASADADPTDVLLCELAASLEQAAGLLGFVDTLPQRTAR